MDDSENHGNIRRFTNIPLESLSKSSRLMLAKHLNPPRSTCSSEGYVQDKDGLAELMGYSYTDCKNYELKTDYTGALLDDWSQKQGSTLALLWQYIEKLERYDIIEDEVLLKKICCDVKRWKHHQQLQNQPSFSSLEIQSPEVSSVDVLGDSNADEFKNITINECRTGVPEYFDAFVCYTSDNFPFVKQMIEQLEGKHGLKLCICNRDLTAGTPQYTTMARLIEQRCKKVIIVLSPSFSSSAECDFQTKFAQSLSPGSRSKKLIPVLIKNPCNPPNILRYITPVDYTKCDLVEWFWERLARSLEENSFGSSDVDHWPEAIPMQQEVLTISSSPSLFRSPSTSSSSSSTSAVSSYGSGQASSADGLFTTSTSTELSVPMEMEQEAGASSHFMPAPPGKEKKKRKEKKKGILKFGR